jgi:hypothetical protein
MPTTPTLLEEQPSPLLGPHSLHTPSTRIPALGALPDAETWRHKYIVQKLIQIHHTLQPDEAIS